MFATVNREKLIETLQTNLRQHRTIFEEALEGYRVKAIENLEAHIGLLKQQKKKPIRLNLHMPLPEDHSSDYEEAIGLLKMSEDQTIRLSNEDFRAYVLDEWGWRSQFIGSNSMYSPTAARIKAEQEDEVESTDFIAR